MATTIARWREHKEQRRRPSRSVEILHATAADEDHRPSLATSSQSSAAASVIDASVLAPAKKATTSLLCVIRASRYVRETKR
jgi:hypothetical protein